MAKAGRRVRWIVTGAVALAVLVLNPVFGVLSGPYFGAAELRAATEGTWRLTVDEGGETRTVTFRIAQGADPDAWQAAQRTSQVELIRPAAACGHRSLVRSAEACKYVTNMPLEVTLLADGTVPGRVQPGIFVVGGNEFELGQLMVEVAGIMLSAEITPAGDVKEVWGGRVDRQAEGQALRFTLARIAR